MTREQEILARAMNGIDDDLIAAAAAPRKKLRHYMPALVAACLCVITVAAFPVLRDVIHVGGEASDNDASPPAMDAPVEDVENGENGGSADMGALLGTFKPEQDAPGPGDTVTFACASVTMTTLSENTATLHIVKEDTTPLYIAFKQAYAGYLASTQPNFRDGEAILRPGQIKLYVDGATEPTDLLPSAAGEYTVLVDFSGLRNGTYLMENTLTLYTYAAATATVEAHAFNINPIYAETADSSTSDETDTAAESET